jgi:hypothetical protein
MGVAMQWRTTGTGRSRILATGLLAIAMGSVAMAGPMPIRVADDCQTPFRVSTNTANPGTTTRSGEIAATRDAGLIGSFGGNGRFADYVIDGVPTLILDTATGMARAQGTFVATSPDGGSSITVTYTGRVDFAGGTATGNFVAGNGTGADAGYRASGTLTGDVIPPATLVGINAGLC